MSPRSNQAIAEPIPSRPGPGVRHSSSLTRAPRRQAEGLPRWLPEGKTAAVSFSVDDVHPSTSADPYEAGGDLRRGGLGRVARLLEMHPQLRATLFVTPDWRPLSLHPTRTWLAKVPLLGERMYLARVRPKGGMRIDRFPEFVRFLNTLPGVEVGVHGLHHLHRGPRLTVEFQEQDRAKSAAMLREALDIFDAAKIDYVRGFQPPGWNLPRALLEALEDLHFSYVSAARDLTTPVSPQARTASCALREFSLLQPEVVDDHPLVHFTHNFQATSPMERAIRIVENGGLLAIKAHIFKAGGGHTLLDGLDDSYSAYLERVFVELHRRYGERLWWASFGQIAERVLGNFQNRMPSN
ncbi:MAG: hypothetical protein DMH00_09170 [Acidobacteria bacterium]|nr:MAG: hypothetical protein DMH00_09170 [Acidobacteriota bacterium]